MFEYLKVLGSYTDIRGSSGRAEYWRFIRRNAMLILLISLHDLTDFPLNQVVPALVDAVWIALMMAVNPIGFQLMPQLLPSLMGASGPEIVLLGMPERFVAVMLALPTLALTVRRLHDVGRTGAWVAVGLIPYFGSVLLAGMASLRALDPPPSG